MTIRKLIRKTKHRDVYDDSLICDDAGVPEIIPEKGYVRIKIDDTECVLTYGQLAYLHIATSIIYGKI